jgi:hypothetical protein
MYIQQGKCFKTTKIETLINTKCVFFFFVKYAIINIVQFTDYFSFNFDDT